MTVAFLGILLLSLALALLSRRGHLHQRVEDFFVASGQFNAVLFFFLAVGETYSIATIFGYPGGVYANGTAFVTWFLGYILLAFVVGYFLNPLIWRAGRIYGAVTMPDLFRRHFQSRALEVVLTCILLIFLVPLGMQQFVGLQIVLTMLNWSLSPLLLTCLAGLLAFAYIVISGIRASAYVAVLKDVLLIVAIVLTALAAASQWHVDGSGVTLHASWKHATMPTLKGDVFSITTILAQCVGFCIVPQTCAYVFTARSANAVRRAQITMPLYMLMFPLLTAIAYFALMHSVHPLSANAVFPTVAQRLLPAPLFGMVLAGAALSALVVLTGICLAIGALVSRNLVPGLSGRQQKYGSQVVIALYLAMAIAGAAMSSQLLVTMTNLFYFGIVQSLPGMLGILFIRRMSPPVIIAGMLTGVVVAVAIYMLDIPVGGANAGFIGLLANLIVVAVGARILPAVSRTPVCALSLRKPETQH